MIWEDYLVLFPRLNLSRISENFSTKSEPLRTLLKNNSAFIWEETESFDEIKTLILNPPMLKYFDVAEQVD